MRQNFDSFLRFEETPCHALGVCQNERNALPRTPSSGERLRVGERSSGMEGWVVAIKHGSTDITII